MEHSTQDLRTAGATHHETDPPTGSTRKRLRLKDLAIAGIGALALTVTIASFNPGQAEAAALDTDIKVAGAQGFYASDQIVENSIFNNGVLQANVENPTVFLPDILATETPMTGPTLPGDKGKTIDVLAAVGCMVPETMTFFILQDGTLVYTTGTTAMGGAISNEDAGEIIELTAGWAFGGADKIDKYAAAVSGFWGGAYYAMIPSDAAIDGTGDQGTTTQSITLMSMGGAIQVTTNFRGGAFPMGGAIDGTGDQGTTEVAGGAIESGTTELKPGETDFIIAAVFGGAQSWKKMGGAGAATIIS